jgi:hypothetical protein
MAFEKGLPELRVRFVTIFVMVSRMVHEKDSSMEWQMVNSTDSKMEIWRALVRDQKRGQTMDVWTDFWMAFWMEFKWGIGTVASMDLWMEFRRETWMA